MGGTQWVDNYIISFIWNPIYTSVYHFLWNSSQNCDLFSPQHKYGTCLVFPSLQFSHDYLKRGLQRILKASITTVYISKLFFFSTAFSSGFSYTPPSMLSLSHLFAFNCKHLQRAENIKRDRKITQSSNGLHRVNCDGSTCHQPAPEQKQCGETVFPPKPTGAAKPCKSKLKR